MSRGLGDVYKRQVLEPQLTELLPYLDKTILINETFYPQLVAELKKLGVKIIPINDSPQTPDELFTLILDLGKQLGNEQKAADLVTKLKSQNVHLNRPLTDTLILSETGVVESYYPQYAVLLNLLGLTPLKTPLTAQNFSLEKVILSQPNVLISLTDKQGYNAQAELLHHPMLQDFFKNQPLVSIPMKYTYCFDHGVWQGAEKIYQQLSKKYNCEYDDRGNIGKRYRRQDEIGTPFCVTYDFDSEEDGAVTVRDRDTMEQERVKIEDLKAYFEKKFEW